MASRQCSPDSSPPRAVHTGLTVALELAADGTNCSSKQRDAIPTLSRLWPHGSRRCPPIAPANPIASRDFWSVARAGLRPAAAAPYRSQREAEANAREWRFVGWHQGGSTTAASAFDATVEAGANCGGRHCASGHVFVHKRDRIAGVGQSGSACRTTVSPDPALTRRAA